MAIKADAHILGPGLAPTPFTAEEIRDGCPQGRTIHLLVDRSGEQFVRFNRYVSCDEAGATIERGLLDDVDVEMEWTSWRDLQAHAAFPETQTTIDRETIDLPVGQVDCLRYTV